jgi:hypothetical protein
MSTCMAIVTLSLSKGGLLEALHPVVKMTG